MSDQNYGMLRVRDIYSDAGRKVLKVFEKLKRKADLAQGGKIRCDPRLGEQDEEPNFEQLNREAVKSLRIVPEVQKTEEGFEVT